MSHRYYEDDYDDRNETRLRYFEGQFKTLAKKLAKERGVTVSSIYSQIKDLKSFKATLEEIFSLDGSLASYVGGMSDRAFELFFSRQSIKDIVDANKEEKIEEYTEEEKGEIPEEVVQEEGEVVEFFKAEYFDKSSGRTKKTLGKADSFKIKGKRREVLRDAKGRFVKRS